MVQNLQWAQKTIKVPQPPKKTPWLCVMNIKTYTTWLSQISQNEETRNTATSFLDFPTDFSRMYTYLREPDEESTRSWTYRSRQSDVTGGTCFLPSDQNRNSRQFPSSKKKTARSRSGNCDRIKSAECIIPLSCRRQSLYQSPWGRQRWEATPPRCCWRPQPATASTALRWWWHDGNWNVTSSSRDDLHPSDAWQ